VIDPVLEPAQLDEQRAELGVAQRAGVDGGELVHGGAQRLQHTHSQTHVRSIRKWINQQIEWTTLWILAARPRRGATFVPAEVWP
jgi:hypothetical protein